VGTAAGKSLEISRTLTLDAGVTYEELALPIPEYPGIGTATDDLFDPAKGGESHVKLRLPVVVADGLKDAQTEAMWKPADVVIVGNFSPFDSDSEIATFDDQESVKRFNLEFSFTPLTSVPEQDTPVLHDDVPGIGDLHDEIRLVNMAELLNFNLVTAEGMVGLIQGLGTALQQIANSGLYAGYDIPFADASLSDLVNYTDPDKAAFSGLIDMLLFDTGGDGIDGAAADANRLVQKVLDSEGNSYLIPWFTTAQTLGSKLQELLGVTANPTYHTVLNELTYEVSLVGGGRTTVAYDDVPAQYDVDLSPFSKLTIDAAADAEDLQAALTGFTGLDMIFGINLSPPGAVIFEETLLEELNGGAGIDIKEELAFTGQTGVPMVLSGNAGIHIDIDTNSDTSSFEYSDWITVLASDTTGNKTIEDFAADIDLAIGRSAVLSGKVKAEVVDGRLALSVITAGHELRVHASSAKDASGNFINPAWTELGFSPYYTSGASVMALKAPTPMVGRLTADATFEIDILTDANGNSVTADPIEVTILKTATDTNRTAADLVADVDNALAAKGLGGLIKADYVVSSTQGTRLVLSARDPDIQFAIRTIYIATHDQLGIPYGWTEANGYDFVIYDRDGTPYQIVLDPTGLERTNGAYDPLDGLPNDPTVDDLITLINAQAGPNISADFNAARTGLRLETTTVGSDPFHVETINGSRAVLTLGFFGAGDQGTQNQFGDGEPDLIEGGAIGVTQLDDRFFVRDAQMWGGLSLQLPGLNAGEIQFEQSGVPGTALLGMVGLDTYLTGSLYAEFSADIKNPVTGIAGGTATLLQLFEGAKQGRLSHDATFDVQFDSESTAVTVTVPQAWTIDNPATLGVDEANDTLAELVANVNQALKDAGLQNDLLAELSGTRIEFVSKRTDVRGTAVNEAAFTITASGMGAAELGLAGTLQSEKVDGQQVVAANSAARYAVTDVNVSFGDLYELPHSGYTEGTTQPFQVGDILYGWDTTPDPDVQTPDSAIVVGIEADKLILARVNGTFADAEIVFQKFGINGMNVAGVLTPRTSFGEFNLHAAVQDGFDDPGFIDGDGSTSGFGLLDGKSYDVAFDITNFGNPYDPAPPVATFDDLVGQTGDLYAFKDLGYDDIGSALHGLLDVLVDVNDEFDLLTLKLPAINRSVNDLLNLVSGFERGVETMDEVFAAALAALDPDAVDLPPLTLQDIPKALRGAFGMPDVAPGDFDWVKLDFDRGDTSDPSDGMLLVDMNLHEALDTKLGLDITVSETLPNLTSAGVLKVDGTLDVNLNFGIDLKHPNNVWLFDDSSIVADVHVEGESQTYETASELDVDPDGMGLVFRASIGPLAVFIQDGDAVIDVAFMLPGLDFGSSD
jgi:hypothetical protein